MSRSNELPSVPPPASPSISSSNFNNNNNSDNVSSINTDDTINSDLSSSSLSSELSSRYYVASHTVRITKHGFAIDPIELKYHDIIRQKTALSRRQSDASFDHQQVAHKILAIIRGFWSQAGFPRGKIIKLDSVDTLQHIYDEFCKNPSYPHKETYGHSTINRINFHKSKKKKSNKQKSLSGKSLNLATVPRYLSPTSEEANYRGQYSHDTDEASFVNLSLPPGLKEPAVQANKSIIASKEPITSQPGGFLSTLFASSSALQTSSSSTTNSTIGSSKKTSPSSSKTSSSTSTKKKSSKQKHTSQVPELISWIPGKDKEEIFDLISDLCKKMQEIFSKEKRIIDIPAPCTVLGDIHGNLIDLRTYERSLWPKAPVCINNNYLFLGDYVDRGDFSIECVLYLFSMKLLAPNRFFLLRGNHEVAAIQRQYTFSRECEIKFGPLGRQLWKGFNKVFDLMPLAAVIDSSIFCAHGGIPRTVSDVKQLAKEIPTPLDNPEIQCPSAWEILWNDPITDSELIGMIEMDNTVVTQTQTIQTQPDRDGNNAITTTISSTIAPENQQQEDKNNNAKKSTTINNNSSNNNINEADAILSREPAVALSFYIRPAAEQAADTTQQKQPKQQQQQQVSSDNNKKNQSATKTSASGVVESARSSAEPSSSSDKSKQQADDSSNTLRTVPSDTSSIASTSPQQMINDGFVANIKRGTAYLFSDQAINNFLKLNNLTHVIRAHEVIPTGFAFHGDGRVITIFSSSKYCGLNNQAACALVDQNKIRILRLDTGEAGE